MHSILIKHEFIGVANTKYMAHETQYMQVITALPIETCRITKVHVESLFKTLYKLELLTDLSRR